jgi:hypothetical protein
MARAAIRGVSKPAIAAGAAIRWYSAEKARAFARAAARGLGAASASRSGARRAPSMTRSAAACG